MRDATKKEGWEVVKEGRRRREEREKKSDDEVRDRRDVCG